jgi:hypothetical protein
VTIQIKDIVQFNDSEFEAIGKCGSGLFDPAQVGVRALMYATWCRHGFHCVYTIADNVLRLSKVYISFSHEDCIALKQGQGPRLFGKVPRHYPWYLSAQEDPVESYDYLVDELDEPMSFSGALVLGGDIIESRMGSMGIPPALKYRTIFEVVFQEGWICDMRDHSASMVKLSDLYEQCYAPQSTISYEAVKHRLAETFANSFQWEH